MADAPDSKSGAARRVGSTPTSGTCVFLVELQLTVLGHGWDCQDSVGIRGANWDNSFYYATLPRLRWPPQRLR